MSTKFMASRHRARRTGRTSFAWRSAGLYTLIAAGSSLAVQAATALDSRANPVMTTQPTSPRFASGPFAQGRAWFAGLALCLACEPAPATTNPEPTPEATQPAETSSSAPTQAPTETPAEAPTDASADPANEAPAPAPPADPLGPLTEPQRAPFLAATPDPKPSELTRNSHYWVSNERSQYLWYDATKDVGGAYIGVGTDQNYMLAGWAKSDLVILLDFDQAIVNLHRVYEILFAKAETPEAFVDLWSEDNEAQVQAWIEAAYPDKEERAPIARAHRIARKIVHMRLRRLVRQYPPLGIPTFATDQAQFDHIKTLWANGRVFAIRGDLTADNAVREMGKALRETQRELGVLYLSNAEQYFDYTPAFRRNILALPFAENSVVLRTLGWASQGFVEGEEYHYNRQGGRNFAGWMKLSRVSKLGRLLRRKTPTDVEGNSVLDREPEVSEKPPEIAEPAL